MPGSNSRPNVSEGYEVPLSYRGDRLALFYTGTKYDTYDIRSITTIGHHMSPSMALGHEERRFYHH